MEPEPRPISDPPATAGPGAMASFTPEEGQAPLGNADHLRLLRLLGRGPLAAVCLAEDTMAGRLVAAKILPGELCGASEEGIRLRKALVPAAHASHPGLIPLRHLHEVWEADAGARALGLERGALVLVSDYVRGTDLSQWVARHAGAASRRRAVLRALGGVAEALDHAHGAGVAHGALSPGNILVRADGTGAVSDLGASRELRRSLHALGLAPARLPESAPWLAPESAAGAPATPAEDVYAFTALLLGALAGDLARHPQDVLPLPWLTPALNSFLGDAISPDPARRPARCGQIATAVQVAAADAEESAAPVPGAGVPRLVLEPAGGLGVQSPASGPRPETQGGEAPAHGPRGLAPAAEAPVPAAESASAAADRTGPAPGIPEGPLPVGAPIRLAATAEAAGATASEQPSPPAAVPAAGSVPGEAVRVAEPVRTVPPVPGRREGRAWPARGVWVAAAAAALLLVGVWVLRPRLPAAATALAEPGWATLDEQTRLAPRFAYTLTLGGGSTPPRLRFRLLGQTRRVDILLEGTSVRALEVRGPRRSAVVGEGSLPAPCAASDVLAVTASPDSLEVFRNGERAVLIPWPGEAIAKVQCQAPEGAGSPGAFRLQKIATLVFADDFMHGEDELGEWEVRSGQWTVHALENPIRSANPFSFLGRGPEALATAGHWFWRGYRLAAAAHPLPGSSFGLKFCWTPPDCGYAVLWSPGADGTGTLRLTRTTPDGTRELATASLGFVPGQWYRLEASQIEDSVRVAVDGRTLISAVDPSPLLGGGVGLWTRGGEGTVFDDVSVGPVEQIEIDFARQSARDLGLLRPLPEGPGRGFCVGGILLENACVETRLQGLAGTRAGDGVELLARHARGEEVALRLGPGKEGWGVRLLARRPAGETVLAESPLATPPDDARVSLHVLGNEAWGTLDGNLILFAGDVTVRGPGLGGVRLPAGGPVTQRALEVRAERPLPELANRVETFEYESSMQSWSSPVLEWNIDYGAKLPVYWHRSDFWQDFTVVMRVRDLPAATASGVVGLAWRPPAADSGPSPGGPLSLLLDPAARELRLVGLPEGAMSLKLMSQRVNELGLERRGGHVLARLDGRVIWDEPLPDALRGLCEIGRYGRGNTREWAEAVTIRAAGVETYPFQRAPVEWFPVRGTWEVTNRWQCDPRWSFYSGVQRGGVACNWYKHRHGPNVTVEFFAGPKMDQDRGRKYEYAGDINAVICADGRDITSGYSFLFGGWDDRGSQIVRGAEIVGENRRIVIPREGSTHRRWFYIKLRKAGDLLSFWVDGSLVATYRDPGPLTGDRFGLWTWDNGIMVAQCRVSSDRIGECVPPVLPAGNAAPRTPYDRQ